MTEVTPYYKALAELNRKDREMSELNIYQRINKVMKEVKYVQKDASVQGYMAVTHDQVVAVARKAFVDNGIVIVPTQQKGNFYDAVTGGKMRLYEGTYDIAFVNIDKPEDRLTVSVEAHAMDHGDKAPGKCLTYATKSAVLKVLWLETGVNDESRANNFKTLEESIKELKPSIDTIKNALSEGDLSTASEAWFELTDEEKTSIWVAPTKGGPFTTEERATMKTPEFRQAKP